MGNIEHNFPLCTVCGMPHNGYEGPCLEPECPGRVTWEATADRLYDRLRGTVGTLVRIATRDYDPLRHESPGSLAREALAVMGIDPRRRGAVVGDRARLTVPAFPTMPDGTTLVAMRVSSDPERFIYGDADALDWVRNQLDRE